MNPPVRPFTRSRVTQVIAHLKFNQVKFNQPLLCVGARGVAVLKLRKLLAHWNITLNTDTELFDISLEDAVKTFQRRMFLPEDGMVRASTWQALYAGTPNHMPILRTGTSGQEVALLQQALCATGEAVNVDGAFDLTTEKSVRNFQKRKGLIVDGVVDSSTWRALSKVPR